PRHGGSKSPGTQMRYRIKVPQVTREGGGSGAKLPEGQFNVSIRSSVPEYERLFQLSIKGTPCTRGCGPTRRSASLGGDGLQTASGLSRRSCRRLACPTRQRQNPRRSTPRLWARGIG